VEIIKFLSNLPGWRTSRKIVVLESDDWGSLRAPSCDGLKQMQKKNLPLGNHEGIRFNQFDDLASHEDLELLFEVLEKIKDKNDRPAVMTALSLVANPDFEKIKANNFEKYYYKSLPHSLDEFNKSSSWPLWKEGFEKGLFIPEFHGREHLNVPSWMRDLKDSNSLASIGFKYKFWGFRQKSGMVSYQAAFDLEHSQDIETHKETLKDGLSLFENLHGRKARFFVPPNGPFNNSLESITTSKGISYLSTSKIHQESLGGGKTKKHFRYLGKKNKANQVYLTRNATFEPSNPRKSDWVDACLKEINSAFQFKKPATISTHRVNYIGVRNEKNRNHGLKELKRLLNEILKKWPEVEFMSSSDLGQLIEQ
jgi:hypothetical protein